jgi:hypothetical protein
LKTSSDNLLVKCSGGISTGDWLHILLFKTGENEKKMTLPVKSNLKIQLGKVYFISWSGESGLDS